MSERTVAMRNIVIDHQENQKQDSINLTTLATVLADTGKNFYSRGWVLGTSGNFSAVTSWQPLRLAISPTGLDKGRLTAAQFLEIDGASNVIRGDGQPSTETMFHLAIIGYVNAGAVLHTHSVWSAWGRCGRCGIKHTCSIL